MDGSPEYKVEAVIASHWIRKSLQYCVKWKGYPSYNNSWDLIQEFHKDNPSALGPPKSLLALKIPKVHKNFSVATLPQGGMQPQERGKDNVNSLPPLAFFRIRPDTSCITKMPWENSTILHNPNASLMTLLAALDNELWLSKVWLPDKLTNQCKVTKICDQGTKIDANLNLSITQQPLDGFGHPNTHFETKHQES
ncbi:Chromobox protein 1 [Entomophthora muscae]|uniref:Chromobox protein 1 n=1 Tax=Entomophthora muscae TaxID=34485 RepID=A0ACC2S4N5_9FUNG|nr:Chromobox protein 1 [Entomophthora muscae]